MFDLKLIIPTKKFGTQLFFTNKTLEIQKMDSGIIQVTDLLERFMLFSVFLGRETRVA